MQEAEEILITINLSIMQSYSYEARSLLRTKLKTKQLQIDPSWSLIFFAITRPLFFEPNLHSSSNSDAYLGIDAMVSGQESLGRIAYQSAKM